MKFTYDAETDALYIDLREGDVEESEEVAPGFVLDFDVEGNVLGLDIDSGASEKVDLSTIETDGLLIGLTPAKERPTRQSKAG